jgi:tetratricopeptide (TPR) repeat protein
LASRAVYEQTCALFEFREVGTIRLKGRIEPVELYELEGPRREPGRVRGIPGLAAPMVGREKEFGQLKAIADRLTTEGQGAVLMVSGDPGLGKSRLVGELKRHLQLAPVRVCEGACLAYGQSPYDVIVKLLHSYFKIRADDDEATKRDNIERRVRALLALDQALADVLPYIENLLAVPLVEKQMRDRIRHLDPSQLRQQTFLAVRDLLVAHARQEPLLLILEDLHWVDKMSLGLLFFLFNSVETAPLVLLCTSRPTENQIASQVQRVGAASLGDRFTHIALQPLTLADSMALIGLLLTISELPESLRRFIPERAEGNPFYLEEIIRTLIDRRIIGRVGDRWEMREGAEIAGFEVPSTLEGLIMARVDNLPEASRHALQCASVIGRDFTTELLVRITGGDTPRLEPNLQDLLDHELVLLKTEQPEREYEFRHVLTQQTVYNSLLIRRREQLHHRIALAIEDVYASRLDEQVERLAFHYTESKDASRGLPYLIRAAERASARFANEEALSYYRNALDLSTQANATLEQRIRILSGLGDAQNFVGDYDGSGASLRGAAELARSAPPSAQQARRIAEIARRLGRVYERRGDIGEALRWLDGALREINRDPESEHSAERARLYLDIGWVHFRQGSLEEAYQWRMRALQISEGLDYYTEMGSAYNGLAAIFVEKYDWHRATEYARQGLTLRETIGDTDGIGRSHSNLGVIAANLCDWTQAISHFERSLEIRQRIGQANGLCNAYTNLGRVYMLTGEATQARKYIGAARKIAEKIHDPDQICLSLNALAETELLDQNWREATLLLEASLQTATEIGSKDHLAQASRILAEARLGEGLLSEAAGSAQQALELAQEMGNRQTEASAYRVQGAIERTGHHWREAQADLSRSIGIFGELKNQFEAARGEFELALLYRDRGMRKDALALFERCYDSFARFGVESYRQRALEALEWQDLDLSEA